MTRRAVLLVVLAVAAPARADESPPAGAPAASPVAPAVADTNPLTERLKPTFELRGRIEADAVAVAQSTSSQALLGDIQNGYGFRRARLGAQGNVGTSSRWVAEIDFANGNFRPRDLYIGLTALPGLRELQVGYFREPFSLEGATSSRFITFLERSPLNVLDPARNWGVAARWWPDSQRGTATVGVFRTGTSDGGFSGTDAGNWAVTSRLTALPVYEDDGGRFRLVHLGGAVSVRAPPNGVVTYAPNPQSNILDVADSPAPPFLPAVRIPATGQQLYNLQAAAVSGPLSVQGEWFATSVQQRGGGPVFLHGFYLDASAFLTGEHRGYDQADGGFSRVAVRRPVVRPSGAPAGGFGAVEVAARFAVADFMSGDLPRPTGGPLARAPDGAVLYQTTLGLNWYLNDYTRVMLNYTLAAPDARGLPTLPVHVFGFRTAIWW